MKKIFDFLTQNDEPVGLKALKLETKPLAAPRMPQRTTQNPWEVPLFVKEGEFYRSLKKIEDRL